MTAGVISLSATGHVAQYTQTYVSTSMSPSTNQRTTTKALHVYI